MNTLAMFFHSQNKFSNTAQWLALVVTFFMLAIATPGRCGDAQGFDSLKGKWVRPDGGYMLVVTEVKADGIVAAGYFNPNPITVDKAKAAQSNGVTTLFVALSGSGYDGSTYRLTYDNATDRLKGIYHQGAMNQDYEIFFERQK